MARPTSIKTAEGGVILLKNCSPETIAKVKASLNPGTSTAPTLVVAQPVGAPVLAEAKAADLSGPLTETALGVYQDKNTLSQYIAQIKYNPYTGKASVVKTENQGSSEIATERFKLLAVKYNLV